jgi:hypothetical protein
MSKSNASGVRLAAEVVAIILSILAAFAIDAWWGTRQEEQHLRTVLEGLEAGYAKHLGLIDENVEYITGDLTLLREFINMDAVDAARISPESTWGTVQSIWRPGTSDDNITFLTSSLEDESLKLLRDPLLREAIAAWRAEVDELDERVGQMAAAEREALRALARHPGVRSALAQSDRGDTRGLSAVPRPSDHEPLVLTGEVMRRVREDEEVMAVAGMKAFHSRIHLQTLGDLRAAADSVLILVRLARAP